MGKSFKDQTNKFYFNNPEVWEKLREPIFNQQVNFIDKAMKRYTKGNRILDVGCGTGKHCELLSELGYKCMGMDLSKAMIDFSKKYENERCKFRIGDMRLKKDYGKEKFDSVLCLTSTFTYNVTNDEINTTLKNFFESLNKGGILIFDLFNSLASLVNKDFNGNFFPEKFEIYEELGLDYDIKHTIIIEEQKLIENKKILDLKSKKPLADDQSEFRMFFPQEIINFLEVAGFEVLEMLGDYDFIKTDLSSPEFVIVAKKS